jgi:hypothetical protein
MFCTINGECESCGRFTPNKAVVYGGMLLYVIMDSFWGVWPPF